MSLTHAKQLLAHNDFDGALKEIEDVEWNAETQTRHQTLLCQLLRAEIFAGKGDYSATKEWSKQALNLSRIIGTRNSEADSSLLLARALVELGNSKESNDLLDHVEAFSHERDAEESGLSSQQTAFMNETRARIHYVRNEYKKAKNTISESQIIWGQLGDELGGVRCMILHAKIIIASDDDGDTAMVYLQEALANVRKLGNKLAMSSALVLIALTHANKNQRDEALRIMQQCLALREDLGSKQGIAEVLAFIGRIKSRKGNLSEGIDFSVQALELLKGLGNTQEAATAHNTVGLIRTRQGDLDQALAAFENVLSIQEAAEAPARVARALNNIGAVRFQRGELNKAQEYFRRSLQIKLKSGTNLEIAAAYNNLGEILKLQGELDTALEYCHKSLSLKKQEAEREPVAVSQKNIGDIHRSLGEFEEALEWYKRSLRIREGIGADDTSCETLFSLVSLCAERDDMETGEPYLERLREISERNPNRLIDQNHRLAKAVVLKNSDRPANRFEAQRLFRQVSEEKIADHDLTVFALLNLFNLLLLELKSSGNEEVLEDVERVSDRLHQIAGQQHSHSLLGEILLLKARLAMLHSDFSRAKRLLDQAELTAHERNLKRLAIKVSNLQDTLLDQSAGEERTTTKGDLTPDPTDLARIEQTVKSLLSKTQEEDIKVVPEEPAMLLIIDGNTGLCIHSKSFDSDKVEGDLNIGGFLSAIDAFIREAFSTTGSVERIKHEHFTLVMKQQQSLRFWYAFKGQSYHALRKLDEFLRVTHDAVPSLWGSDDDDDDETTRHLTIHESSLLDSRAEDVFLRTDT